METIELVLWILVAVLVVFLLINVQRRKNLPDDVVPDVVPDDDSIEPEHSRPNILAALHPRLFEYSTQALTKWTTESCGPADIRTMVLSLSGVQDPPYAINKSEPVLASVILVNRSADYVSFSPIVGTMAGDCWSGTYPAIEAASGNAVSWSNGNKLENGKLLPSFSGQAFKLWVNGVDAVEFNYDGSRLALPNVGPSQVVRVIVDGWPSTDVQRRHKVEFQVL